MNEKEKIQKQIEEVQATIIGFNTMLSQGKYLESEQIAQMSHAFTKLDSLLFRLRSLEDGTE